MDGGRHICILTRVVDGKKREYFSCEKIIRNEIGMPHMSGAETRPMHNDGNLTTLLQLSRWCRRLNMAALAVAVFRYYTRMRTYPLIGKHFGLSPRYKSANGR